MHKLPKKLTTPTAKALYKCLNTSGQTRFVGGCVRDALLNLPITDVDLATTLLPQEVIKKLTKAGFTTIPIGIEHGTILAIKNKEQFEVTTLRKDITTDGRHAKVAFTTAFEEDAARRDFTFNALYMDENGTVTDFFNGVNDLHQGHVRFVGCPKTRLKEDFLRALRYIRFYGKYAKTQPDELTQKALTEASTHLKNLSRERKTEELLKITSLQNGEKSFTLMAKLGFLKALNLEGFSTKNYATFKKIYPQAAPLTKLVAGVWHSETSSGLISHSSSTPFFETALLKNPHLRFSNTEKKLLRALHPQKAKLLDTAFPHYSAYTLGAEEYATALWQQVYIHAPQASKPHIQKALTQLLQPFPPFPFSGKDLIQMGFSEGKNLGAILQKGKILWLKLELKTPQEVKTWLKTQKRPVK